MSKQRRKRKGRGMSPKKKKVINNILLTVSIGVSTYIFAQMADIIIVQFLFFVLIAIYELVMQGVLGVGLILIKTGIKAGGWKVLQILPGALCILFYIGGYVGIYAVPTAMGVFLLFIDQQSVKAEITQTEYDFQKEILDLDIEAAKTYNLQMQTEAQTGYGRQSEKITQEQNKLRESLAAGLERFREVSKARTSVSVDVFESLSETVKPIKEVSPTVIKLAMFLVIFFGMYIGLIFTHEEFGFSALDGEEEEEGEDDGSGDDESSQSLSFKTSATKKNKPSRKLRDKTFQEKESFAESSGQSSSGSSEVLTPKVSASEKTSLEGLPRITKAPKSQSEWERFIRASVRESGILNSAKRVSMLTGIPIDRCLEYRKRLDEMRIGGEPVVETTQGGSRANFGKDEILEMVRGTMVV